jgi:hypothetical protein
MRLCVKRLSCSVSEISQEQELVIGDPKSPFLPYHRDSDFGYLGSR